MNLSAGILSLFDFPNRNECFVKRIIAFGGETIEIRDGFVYIDGKMLDETEYAGEWYGKKSVRVCAFVPSAALTAYTPCPRAVFL